jgi:Rod binding domain-containing protein
MIDGVNLAASGAPAGFGSVRPKDDPEKVRSAAQQFESLLLAQLLKTAREGQSEGWLGSGEDNASASAMDIAEQQFAHLLAAGGGLGLTKLVVEGLGRER